MAARRAKKKAGNAAPGRGHYDRALSRAERRARQHALLVEASAAVFAEVGFAAATVEAIVKEAGMSRRTFYEHFERLEDALLEVHDSLAGQAFALLELALQAFEDPLEQLRVGTQTFFGLVASNGPLARVIFREVRLAGPDFEARWELQTMRYVELLERAIGLAHQRGQLVRPPDEAVIFALITGAEALAMRALRRGEEASLIDVAPRLAEAIIRAFQ